MPTHSTSVSRAATWMAGWLTLMLVMAVAGREATRALSVFQVMLLRSVLGLVMLWPLIRAAGGIQAMKTLRLPQHVARNLVHYAAQYGWFVALTLIPLAQVVALEFTMPIWSAALAVAFLGERMNRWKVLAVALGLAGVAVIVKSLTRTDTAIQVSFWMLVVQSALGLVPALLVWQWPSAQAWGWVVVVAFCGTFSHYCFARAMQHADATVVVPMDFLRVPLTAAAGWAVYAERVDLFTALGVALILGGNLLNLRRAPMLR